MRSTNDMTTNLPNRLSNHHISELDRNVCVMHALIDEASEIECLALC
jgi:hypothetical protein